MAKELATGALEDMARWPRDDIEDRRAVVERRSAEREKRPFDEHLALEQQLTRDNQELDASLLLSLQSFVVFVFEDARELGYERSCPVRFL